ncbi:FtsX-like permease family protein [Candidatus Pacearchaeota archaeon]|nr:FtsX-like permease family protein [Candidatus Pacearchaeota archaeon]
MIGKESIIYSLRNLKNRKTRSLFTIFSIMMGITTIFIFVSYGLGLYKYIEDVSTGSSVDKLLIQPKGSALAGMDTTFSFSEDDLKAVEQTAGVYDASGIYFKVVELTQKKKLAYTYLISYDPAKPLIMELFNLDIIKGRQLKPGDSGVVLGYNYQFPDKIFSKSYSLNQNIEVQGLDLKILGFYSQVGNPQDDLQIYVTNDKIKEIFSDENLSYNWIIAEVDVTRMDSIKKNIERALRNERGLEKGKEDFFVQSYDEMIESYSSVLDIVIGFIILIALISVLVSSINTANTMVTSVLERVKEIGVIKSIGGKNSEVFNIFLFESAFLGFIAGVIGVVLGWILSFIGSLILDQIGYSFLSPYFPISLFLGCILFAVLTGAISGVIPAVKASKTNPVETLRYE